MNLMTATAWGRFAMLAWALVAPAGAKSLFRAPFDVPPPFRRELLSLDVDTIHALSQRLTGLGIAAANSEEPSLRRAAAQLFALAEALDPANREPRDLAKQIQRGDPPEPPPDKRLADDRAWAWRIWTWLASEPAGPDSQTFAGYLGDALATIDSGFSSAAALRNAGEKGRWSGWVADLTVFQPEKRSGNGNGGDNAPKANPNLGNGTAATQVPPGPAQIRLKSAQVGMHLFYYDAETKNMASAIVPVTMNAWNEEPASETSKDSASGNTSSSKDSSSKESPPPPAFEIRLAAVSDSARLARYQDVCHGPLRQLYGSLPSTGRIGLQFGNKLDYSVSWNADAYTGPAAVLADAALRGRAPVENVTIFGVLHRDGKLALPTLAWDRLLDCNSKDRFLVPKEALELLTGLLVLERPEFFLDHEVIAASTFPELIDRSGTATQGPFAEALGKFAEIRRAGANKPVGQFVAHPSTRQRLADVLQLFPDHLSARLLLVQASGTRPTKFATPILAREIRRNLKPMAAVAAADYHGILYARVETAHGACRKELDALASRTDLRDRPLLEEAIALANTLRTMGRSLKNLPPMSASDYDYKNPRETTIKPQLHEIARQYNAFLKTLDGLCGDTNTSAGSS